MSSSYRSNGNSVVEAMRRRFQAGAVTMGGDILAASTPVTPRRSGDLRQRRRVISTDKGARVMWLTPYAGVQNRGSRRGITFRAYTTPGTGPRFAEAGIEAVMPRLGSYFR